jgi:hypothetical protein
MAQLRKATGTLTGTVFFGTLLRTMRNSAMKGPIGHGGRGEEIFAEQLHGVLAERIGSSTQSNLGDIVFKHLERQQRAISDARAAQKDREV